MNTSTKPTTSQGDVNTSNQLPQDIKKCKYPKIKKEILKNKIEKIRNKIVLANIFLIIESENNDIMSNSTVNSNGIHMLFNNLAYDTYIQLERYISRYERNRQKEISEMQNSDDLRYSDSMNAHNSSEYAETSMSKLKYSNKEKMLIRRCEYDTALPTN